MGICFLCLFGTDVACLEYGVWSRWSLMFKHLVERVLSVVCTRWGLDFGGGNSILEVLKQVLPRWRLLNIGSTC